MADVYLTPRDIDYISRVVATEVPGSIRNTNPEMYNRMVAGVVDTITNRIASPDYPDTATGVLNEDRAFSKITGPARRDPYGSVQATPAAPSYVTQAVNNIIADRVQGVPSEIGSAVNYANPNFSDQSNLVGWINPMIEAGAVELGLGNEVHFHGTPPGTDPAPEYTLSATGMPSGTIPTPTLKADALPPSGFMDLARANMPNQGLLASYDETLASPDDFASVLNSQQAQQADGIMAAINPAVPTSVQRAALADMPAMPAVQQTVTPPTSDFSIMAAAPQPGLLSSVPSVPSVAPVDVSNVIKFDPLQGTPMPAEDYQAAPVQRTVDPVDTAATIAGPATTEIASAPVQAAKTAVTRAAAPVTQAQPAEQPGLLAKVNDTLGTNLTKESLAGGVLGGMTLGPIGGLLGSLAGSYVAKNGGLGGLFSGLGQPVSVNNIGSGYQNVQSVYGGAAPGTQANTNNGGRVTSLPGGKVAYTNSYGVTTVSNADGTGQGSYFGDTKF